MSNFNEYLSARDESEYGLTEASHHSNYSIEVNYRSEIDEVIDGFAKLCLGYASAALKRCGYHCKTIFSTKPYRILVGTRNWDDGEWIAMAIFNHKEKKFVIAEGSYNKDKKTVTIHKSHKTEHKNAAEIVKELRNILEKLKRTEPVRSDSMVAAPMKRGPKMKGFTNMRKSKSIFKSNSIF